MRIHRSIGLALALAVAGGATASGATLVHYDFEDAVATGTAPQREWQVTDQAGPDLTNFTVTESAGDRIDAFNGGQGLYLSDNFVSLGTGANDELKTDFSDGFIIEATFNLGGDSIATTHQYIIGRLDSFGLHVRAQSTGTALLVRGSAGSVSVDSGEAIELNTTYQVRLVFDPHQDLLSLELDNLTDAAAPILTTASIAANSVGGIENAVEIAGGGLGHQRFHGYIDDVRIAVLPEPGTIVLLATGGLLMLARHRR